MGTSEIAAAELSAGIKPVAFIDLWREMKTLSTMGIPQVAYQSLNQSAVEWLDVYHRLALEGIYFLSSRTSSESVGHLVGSLLYGGGDTSRALCINGSGGDVFSGSSVGDCMQQGTSGVTTVILGTARSIACVISLMGFIRYGLVH